MEATSSQKSTRRRSTFVSRTLIIEIGVAISKKTNRWAALNSVLQFDIKYERQIIAFLDERREQRGVVVSPVLSETWWV
jgi:hypothetical protein